MGEAWSDYYAMDYLVTQGLREGHRQVRARSSRASTSLAGHDRSAPMAIDCPVDARSPELRPASTARSGGYTYGDFPTHRRRARGARQR